MNHIKDWMLIMLMGLMVDFIVFLGIILQIKEKTLVMKEGKIMLNIFYLYIKITTHSMGAAYAKGFIKRLIVAGVPVNLIEFEADFAPFQPTKQKAVAGVQTYQFSNDYDYVTNNILFGSPYGPMEGADVTTDNYKNKEHSIQDFIDKIKDLPEGTYKRLNGEIVRQ